MTLEQIIAEARGLSRAEQADLLDALICLVDSPDALALTPAQKEDLDRRMEEARSGKEKTIPGDEAIRLLRERSGKQ